MKLKWFIRMHVTSFHRKKKTNDKCESSMLPFDSVSFDRLFLFDGASAQPAEQSHRCRVILRTIYADGSKIRLMISIGSTKIQGHRLATWEQDHRMITLLEKPNLVRQKPNQAFKPQHSFDIYVQFCVTKSVQYLFVITFFLVFYL